MEVNIFPFTCKIYTVNCKFCGKFLGHLVVELDAYGIEDIARNSFQWCSPECHEKIVEVTKDFNGLWLTIIPLEIIPPATAG